MISSPLPMTMPTEIPTPSPAPKPAWIMATHVAGIAAANSGDTIRGVAPDAQVVAMKVFDDLLGQGRGVQYHCGQWRMR